MTTFLDQLVGSGAVPGANLLIARDGLEDYYYETGYRDIEQALPVRRDTIFRIYSMTKPVIAAAVMALVDAGRLRLDDPVSQYIPELSSPRVYSEGSDSARIGSGAPMRVRDLLTHTAGFTYSFQTAEPVAALYDTELGAGPMERWRFDPELGGLQQFVRSLSRLPLVSAPGVRWHYSMSQDVAGAVIERVGDMPLDAALRTWIFDPLDMRDTGFWVPPDSASRLAALYQLGLDGGLEILDSATSSPLLGPVSGLSGGGGLVSTVDDYARFAGALLDGGEVGGVRILSPAAVEEMLTSQLHRSQLEELPLLAAYGLGGSGDGLGFGLGGAVVDDPSRMGAPYSRGEYGWGGAASTTFWVDPENRMVVVFMTQLLPPSSEMIRDGLHRAIYPEALSGVRMDSSADVGPGESTATFEEQSG